MSSQHSLCDGISEAYSIPFHTGAIFVILFASIFGTVLPIITLYVPFLRKNPFIFVIAKTAATGVLLSVSTIHLLGDGLSAFNEYCVPQSFKDVYPEYGLFFTVFAALIMHFIDYKMVSIGEEWMKRQNARNAHESNDDNGDNKNYNNNNILDHKLHECNSIIDHKLCNDNDNNNKGCNGNYHVAKEHMKQQQQQYQLTNCTNSTCTRKNHDHQNYFAERRKQCEEVSSSSTCDLEGNVESGVNAKYNNEPLCDCGCSDAETVSPYYYKSQNNTCQNNKCYGKNNDSKQMLNKTNSLITTHNNVYVEQEVEEQQIQAEEEKEKDNYCTVHNTGKSVCEDVNKCSTNHTLTCNVNVCINEQENATEEVGDECTATSNTGHSVQLNLPECGCHKTDIKPPMDMTQLRRVIAAICMEFGVTLHSLFVGLDVGLTTDRSLKPLLIALVFHQMFEGMSMGSRLVDAKFHIALEFILAMVFSFSAPLGMAAATIAASVKPDAMAGTGFVLMMAVLDSICAGILLYLAFNLLFIDFAVEMERFCAIGMPGRQKKKYAMFGALWCGMLLMAIIGKWC